MSPAKPDDADVLLHGFSLSVYVRIARMTLAEKGVAYSLQEVNPFAPLPDGYTNLHPFGRVPVLEHGSFPLHETGAIVRYIDRAFAGPSLVPTAPQEAARVDQVIAITDNYAYWPLVRQVFTQSVMQPLLGASPDAAEIEAGLTEAARVLGALERLFAETPVLANAAPTLATCYLAPMIAYFVQAAEGRAELERHSALWAWWNAVKDRPSLVNSAPDFSSLGRS